MNNWKILQRGTLVHKDTLEIYEYIHYKNGNLPAEPFITAVAFNEAVDEKQKVKFSVPIDAGVLDGQSNYKIYPNETPQAIKLMLEAENLIQKF